MAYATDLLKERRKKKGMVPDQNAAPDKGNGGEEGSEHEPSDRSIQLSDSELKSLEGTYQPGEEAECLVRGRIDKNGTLDVISVEPPGGKMEKPMAPPMGGQPPMMGGMGSMPGMMG